MNGAEALIRTLVNSGVEVCFTNPGTSEMHFIAALDSVPEMRAVLGLFEGVVTGAADGYARMTDSPAATLLHLGPGLGNGIANLHNARRARVPIVNIIGDHATSHRIYDAPLQSDIESLARNVSGWYRSSATTAELAGDAADAVAASHQPPGQVATLVLPADVSWTEGASPVAARPRPVANEVSGDVIDSIAKVLRSGEPAALMVGGRATRERGLLAAQRVAAATGAKIIGETFPTRLERGAGLPAIDRLGYLAEFAMAQLAGLRHLILVDAKSPASFFAYPNKPSDLVPDGCKVHVLASGSDDPTAALQTLAEALGAANADIELQNAVRPDRPTGDLTGETIGNALGAVLPDGAIVADESNTSGLWTSGATAGVPRHDWLTLTGGAIGFGMPVATGAAIACPDRPVISLQADGSAMYTLQALWTQVREDLNVTTVIFNNRSYAILNLELSRVGVETPGPKALSMLDLSNPDIDFVALATGMGMAAERPETAEDLTDALERAIAEPGPHLIEAMLPGRW
ncbi:MAG: acetolactate synthase large subunit [Acidimicrobiia bacterium]|nr:acetolactate synthase large subunit [Acidimicrobiia bacterium]